MTERFDVVVVGLGALGSSAAHELARRGRRVLGLEQFPLGHVRGASHDTSRILRHSYHNAAYVRLTFDAYDDWARLERDSGVSLVTTVGGLDLFPPGSAIDIADYHDAMRRGGVSTTELDAAGIGRRWPQFRVPDGTIGLWQPRGAIVPAALGTRAMAEQARRRGAVLRDESPVTLVQDLGAGGIEIEAGGRRYLCERLVVCADAWTNEVLSGLGHRIPLQVTLEQVTYFEPEQPQQFAPTTMPVWIWVDDPCFYGFPTYGEPTVKAAQDCGGPSVDPDDRSFAPDSGMQQRLSDFMAARLPGSGRPVRSVRCLYALTPDRDFVVGPVPGHPAVVVGLGAAHGFKFAPTLGRLLAELIVDGSSSADVTPFQLDRPALTDPDYVPHVLV